MANFNKVILIGNITADPELRVTTTGKQVCSFRIAVGRKAQKDQTDFIDVVTWNKTAEFVAQYFTKGNSILVCGSLQTRAYETQDGSKRKVVEVVADEVSFVEKKETAQPTETPAVARPMCPPAGYAAQEEYIPQAVANFPEQTPDEELPF